MIGGIVECLKYLLMNQRFMMLSPFRINDSKILRINILLEPIYLTLVKDKQSLIGPLLKLLCELQFACLC